MYKKQKKIQSDALRDAIMKKKKCLLLDAQGFKLCDLYEEYGVCKTSHQKYQKILASYLKMKDMKEVRAALKGKQFKILDVAKMIEEIPFAKRGRPTLLTKDEEELLVAELEMAATSEMGKKFTSLAHGVIDVIEGLQEYGIMPETKCNSKSKFQRARRIVKRVKEVVPDCDGSKKKKTKHGD